MNRKIKVGVVIDQLLPGGVQKTAIEEVKNLRKLGCSASLLILMRKGFEKKSQYLVKDIPFEFLSDRYPKLLQKSFKLPFFTFLSTLHLVSPIFIPLKVKSREFDLIVWSLSKFLKIPYFAVIHDPMIYILDKVYKATPLKYFFPVIKPAAKILEEKFVKAAALCLVDSNVHAEYLLKAYKIKPQVLHLGINIPAKLPSKLGNNILAFGRWDAGKHPRILLKLLKRLPQKINLVLAGNWTNKNDLAEFKKEVNKLKLGGRVEVIPQYTETQLPQICQRGRVWVHPHFEAFSLSALEAASHGLPLVIPKKSGVTELFQDGVHGFFPKKADVKNLKTAILPFLKDEKLAHKMGAKAALVARTHTHRNRAEVLLNLIKQTAFKEKPLEIVALETGHASETYLAGGDRVLEKMARFFPKNYQLQIITPTFGIKHWRKSGLKNFSEVLLPPNPFDNKTQPFQIFFAYLIRIWQSIFMLNRINADLIVSSTNVMPDVIPAFIIKLKKTKVPWIVRVHHLILKPHLRPGNKLVNFASYLMQLVSLLAIRLNADLIVSVSETTTGTLKQFGFAHGKLATVSNGVDFSKINRVKNTKKYNFDAVFLGRFHPSKGIFDLPEIWQEVIKIKPNANLAIIGSGFPQILKKLKDEIVIRNLENNIEILESLSENQVITVLKGAKMFLFTDHEAGFSLATAEAMATGLPVIAYDLPVFKEIYKKGAINVPLSDKKSFARGVISLLKNQSLRFKLGMHARKQAKVFDWSKSTKQFVNLINEKVKNY